jgi:lambda repressor-like predicted transcriptional regulator
MTVGQLQGALKDAGYTQKSFAKEIGRSENSVSRTIHRKMISDYIMRHLAKRIKKPPHEVFPEYYLQPAQRSTSKVVRL